MNSDVVQMALKIADSAAISDIECHCVTHGGNTKDGWLYDTSKIEGDLDDDREFIDEALAYLDARGLITRDPSNAALVSINHRATT